MIKKLVLSLGLAFSLNASADNILDLFSASTGAVDIPCRTVENKKICDIFFNDTIESPGAYQGIKKMALSLNNKDTVILHLAGNGGDGAGLVYIINALKQSHAHVVGSMEGSIASAHVFLLAASDEIQINGDGFLLFHAISGLNMIEDHCVEVTGKDRGLAKYTKCVENMTAMMAFYNKTLNKYAERYLTKDEMIRYLQGHDIIIDSDEMRLRLKNGK